MWTSIPDTSTNDIWTSSADEIDAEMSMSFSSPSDAVKVPNCAPVCCIRTQRTIQYFSTEFNHLLPCCAIMHSLKLYGPEHRAQKICSTNMTCGHI